LTFGKKLRFLRKKNGLTQAQLANLLDISDTAIRLYETEKRFPKKIILLELAKLFKIPIDILYNDNMDICEQDESENQELLAIEKNVIDILSNSNISEFEKDRFIKKILDLYFGFKLKTNDHNID